MNFKLSLLLSCLATATATASVFVIYGDDDRQETIMTSPFLQDLADSTAAMIEEKNISINGALVSIKGPSLGERFGLCKDERFYSQTSAAYCSGFLVAPDIMATAGHCFQNESYCETAVWVFNYKLKDEKDSSVTVSKNDIYRCQSILKKEFGNNSRNDYALIKLDRKVEGHFPVKISKEDPEIGEALVMIGHPSGLPQKIDDGGFVRSKTLNGFKANLDAFQINSGSAVFSAKSGELVGILVTGAKDYRSRLNDNCTEVNPVSDDRGDEGVSSVKQFEAQISLPGGRLIKHYFEDGR